MFLLVTSRRNELEGRATFQIVGNLNAILNLSNFFKIDEELAEILPSEVDRTITKFLGSNYLHSHNLTNANTEDRQFWKMKS